MAKTKTQEPEMQEMQEQSLPETQEPVEGSPEWYEELVTYHAPMPRSEEDKDILVGVNGQFLQIKLGAIVEIPRKFFLALQDAEEQHQAAIIRKRQKN